MDTLKRDDHCFVIIAHRWGNRNNHSYLVGTTRTEEDAVIIADNEETFRNGCYSCEIVKSPFITKDTDLYVTDLNEINGEVSGEPLPHKYEDSWSE